MACRTPLVVVLGATGAGKSKLALELAQKFYGEIISADSMQIYKGLDIITNKVTQEEQKLVPHHMLDFLSPLTKNYTVVDFRNQALPIVEELLADNKLPVIVGGTNYYIESLLWNFLTDQPVQRADVSSGTIETTERQQETTEALYEKLSQMDLASSQRIHPKDRRKIVRALDVYESKKERLSDIHSRQHSEEGGSVLSGALRYPNTCILWVQCDQTVLEERTNKRVDSMINAGLLTELEEFHKTHIQPMDEQSTSDFTLGILQNIGLKEFQPYLTLPEEQKLCHGEKFLNEGIEQLKLATRQYARRQKKWIVSRFLKRRGNNMPPVYAVDSTDPSRWQEDVFAPALEIVQSYYKGETPAHAPILPTGKHNKHEFNRCAVCDMTFVTLFEWEAHLKGRKHKKRLQSVSKKSCQRPSGFKDLSTEHSVNANVS